MSASKESVRVRKRIRGLPRELQWIIVEQDPLPYIRALHSYEDEYYQEQVSRALQTYLWRRVLGIQFEGLQNEPRTGGVFLIGHELGRLRGYLMRKVKQRFPCNLVLAWPIDGFKLRPNKVEQGFSDESDSDDENVRLPMTVSRVQEPRIDLLLTKALSFEVDYLSKYFEKDSSGVVRTYVAYLHSTQYAIDQVEVNMEVVERSDPTMYWHEYKYTLRVRGVTVSMKQRNHISTQKAPRAAPF
ncbi:hypothetical protein BB8028_0007g00130 [Beauveria bassiana]|uniref:Uncharacterized protein n=1 Tax=Beauveria bassiana TaxID=176275 RepID=A0A2S7YLI7_BEABA|nr:hypothetical protein BB8028_0007g00130 [Beauveria bassiana]